LLAYKNNLIDIPVFCRLKGTESEKAKEMLQGSKTKIYDTVEDAINAAVMGIKK
jgi:succinyl-CoA synthetase beta subunit